MDKSCRPNDLGIYYSYDEAREKCLQLDNCKMCYDSRGSGTAFVLCGLGATALRSFDGSILYVKKGKQLIHL